MLGGSAHTMAQDGEVLHMGKDWEDFLGLMALTVLFLGIVATFVACLIVAARFWVILSTLTWE